VLDEPVVVLMEDGGRVAFDGGVEYRLWPNGISVMMVPGQLECEGEVEERWLAFGIKERDLERPAANTEGGSPITVTWGETYAQATQGWVRIDERTDASVRGAMSWVSEGEDGETVAWAEGAFNLTVCDRTQ